MRRPRETINAAVLATAIWIDAGFKADVRALIACDYRFRRIAKILRRNWRALVLIRIDPPPLSFGVAGIGKIDMQFLETIGWTPRSAATTNRFATLRRFGDNRD